ncbi:hypothetical protein BCY91_14170 [Pelobium manganitolerans]|uniref:Uncharacterized protein n=1 Tax=Pelobium manganitolerans TaxID=1842495 RepID=A0A419S9V9_9SPHI|nr:hypothetical protein [Pelobium manganitolerans]RKD19019.1 hypothetical protein BCY91_14170 [Pelobium manganitolerans]
MQNFITEFTANTLGGLSLAYYASTMLFALIGAIIGLRISSLKRDKTSINTPYKFNFWFLIRDNAQRLLTNFLICFVVFRFAGTFLDTPGIDVMLSAVGVGLFFDQFVAKMVAKFEANARD